MFKLKNDKYRLLFDTETEGANDNRATLLMKTDGNLVLSHFYNDDKYAEIKWKSNTFLDNELDEK